MSKMTPMETLKAATGTWHQALESHAQSHQIMDLSLSRKGFERLIAFQHSLHQAIEPQIIPLLDQHFPLLAYGETRQKREALEADLRQLSPAQPPPQIDVNFITSACSALGSAYVLEGSTLGGQVILRHLKKMPEIAVDEPFRYYGLYGSEVGPRWKVFQQITNEALDTPEKVAEATEAAVATFKTACKIYEQMENAELKASSV